ncbi:MAG TPA: methyltransferase domain-containing protein [Gemmatimonadales bacterium]|nr:methyltransferase domain-containing protein [Gemmatimonadales bacterium]
MTLAPVVHAARPSSWFVRHVPLVRAGHRVLDLACGDGRHALAAAARGARVLAVDRDPAQLAAGRAAAEARGLADDAIEWRLLDLTAPWPDAWRAEGRGGRGFDVVLVFNYLDRARMPMVVDCVAPGGALLMETFLERQRDYGWGPTSPAHLLRSGELAGLVRPLALQHGREVIEPVGGDRYRAVASVLARRP